MEDKESNQEAHPAAATDAAPHGSAAVPDYLKELPVKVDVLLGSVKMTVRELMECGPGSVLDVGKNVNDAFDLLINDNLVARGEIVMMGERLGLKITEVIVPGTAH